VSQEGPEGALTSGTHEEEAILAMMKRRSYKAPKKSEEDGAKLLGPLCRES